MCQLEVQKVKWMLNRNVSVNGKKCLLCRPLSLNNVALIPVKSFLLLMEKESSIFFLFFFLKRSQSIQI